MKFMCIVKAREPKDQPLQPPQALFGAIDDLAKEATAKGAFAGMGGLLPTAKGASARLAKGKITITDGPFAEAKEVIGGYAIYDVKDKAEAVEWTRRFLQLHIDHWPGFECEVEVRQMMEF